jgi:phytoene/squalene synthetase
MNKISSEEFCRNFVRRENYNLYLLQFFAPRTKRHGIIAMMALHTELLQIPQKAADPTMRLIRLQWWRDEIEKMQNKKPHADSPILDELQNVKAIFFEKYLNIFDEFCRGEAVDLDEPLYGLFGKIINDEKATNRCSKKLFTHDNLPPETKFRAIRLWLGI